MSAADQMRAMLDQLMGTARNGEFKLHLLPQFLPIHSYTHAKANSVSHEKQDSRYQMHAGGELQE